MKSLSLLSILVGALSLVIAVVDKLGHWKLLMVTSSNYVSVASALFLFAVAIMCYAHWFPGSKDDSGSSS